MTFATMIRNARVRSRLSLRRVAELASCSPSHLSRLETGQLTPSRKLSRASRVCLASTST